SLTQAPKERWYARGARDQRKQCRHPRFLRARSRAESGLESSERLMSPFFLGASGRRAPSWETGIGYSRQQENPMSTTSSVVTDSDIVARCAAGMLIADIDAEDDSSLPDSLRNRAIHLHNKGQLNLLDQIATPAFDHLTGFAFFRQQQVYVALIPDLEAPLSQMMAAVHRLIEKAGNDSATIFAAQAFQAWLARD